MLNVKGVGTDLTPVQQDEVLADLAFFLDEFGSTHAVRAKLQDQERAIKRLITQAQCLESPNFEFPPVEDGYILAESSTLAVESVDEMMADLDFFFRTFGSTRAVCARQKTQKQEILGLQRKVQMLQDLRQKGNDRGQVERKINASSITPTLCEQLKGYLEIRGTKSKNPTPRQISRFGIDGEKRSAICDVEKGDGCPGAVIGSAACAMTLIQHKRQTRSKSGAFSGEKSGVEQAAITPTGFMALPEVFAGLKIPGVCDIDAERSLCEQIKSPKNFAENSFVATEKLAISHRR